jgi:PadR family transcriptional regulator, regulatory protein PadR
MSVGSSDNLLGALELLVLKALESGAMHGWGITLHIQTVSNEVLRVEEGSLYPALHRMEKAGWVKAEWGLSENNRRARFYKIRKSGRAWHRRLRWCCAARRWHRRGRWAGFRGGERAEMTS